MIRRWILLFFVLASIKLQAQDYQDQSVDELNRQLENPLSRFWSLILQENFSFNTGELVNGTATSNVLNFQPSLPAPVGKGKMLLVRPVFPLVTAPILDEQGNVVETKTGFGDLNVFSLYGPDKKDGISWGAGMTFTFPTASSDYLGNGKVQLGPALMILSITPNWTIGGIVQHWSSVGGDEERPDVTRTDIQYIIRKQIKGKGMSIGMGPNIAINWEASEGNKVNFPIGLGITKTVKWNGAPWKLRLEPQYSIIKEDDFGSKWNIRVQVARIINSPFF